MPCRIRVLSENTINQIAAGEVIESPASVVKELCENSIDAGSKKIVIEIQGGGLHLIRITDDGCGMGKDDALLCLERHATSKIYEAKDLLSVKTMGFRGEALASIASISKLTLSTSEKEIGTRIEMEGGSIKSVSPYPRNQGTTIEVRHLFFNVPARKKFQKSPSGCSAEITKALTQLSLAYPYISFTLHQNDTLAFQFEKGESPLFIDNLKKRVADSLGEGMRSAVIAVDDQEGAFLLRGILGAPENTRHNRTGQYLFINQRAVISPLISFAIKDAYGTRIGSDRHPTYVLHINMPCELLDVNVHPQKKEVRIANEEWIRQSVRKVIQRHLDKSIQILLEKQAPIFSDFSLDEPAWEEPKKSLIERILPYECHLREEVQPVKAIELPMEDLAIYPIALWGNYLLMDPKGLNANICSPSDQGLCFVDIKSAKARVLFEKFLLSKVDPCHKQGLLFPLVVDVALYEAQHLLAMMPLLSAMGFSLSQSGPRSFLIDAIPAFFPENKGVDALLEILCQTISLDTEDQESLEIKKTRKIAGILCKYIQTHTMINSIQEATLIVKELLRCDSPNYCPQGNKIFAFVSNKYVAGLFISKDR